MNEKNRPESQARVLHRLRVTYSKLEAGRFLSHLDLCNLMGRAIRRIDLPVAFSEGFTPRPRLAFGPPLPLFVEGENEQVDIDLTAKLDPAEIIHRLNDTLVEGVRTLEASYVDPRSPSITASIDRAHYVVTGREVGICFPQTRLDQVLASPSIVIEKTSKGIKKAVEIRPSIFSLLEIDRGFRAVLSAAPSRTLNIFDLLTVLDPGFTIQEGFRYRVVRSMMTSQGT